MLDEKQLKQIVELNIEIDGYKHDMSVFETQLLRLQEIIDAGPILSEDEILHTLHVYQYRSQHYQRKLVKSDKNRMVCSYCGGIKKKATIWYNLETCEMLVLCFHGCQHFPDPFNDTEAGVDEQKRASWIRIDPWQEYIKRQPQLSKTHDMVIAQIPQKQLKLK